MEKVEVINTSMAHNGKYGPVEVEHVHKNGTEFTMLMNSVYLNDKNGKPEYIASSATDIEQWKLAEKERAANYLELANVMFIALDKEGTVTLANKKSCEVLGWNEEDVVGKNWFDNFLPVHLRKAVRNVARQVMQGDLKPVENYENPVLTKSGQERLIAWHNTTLRNQAGEITGHLSAGEDITSRKLADKKLLLGERILEASQDHILVVGSDYTYRYVNKAYTDAHGSPASQIIGENIADRLGTEIFEKTV